MIKVKRFVNQLMTSNCYLVYDEETKKCLVIDPGSEVSEREIDFVNSHELELDYIIITHEHTDHNWGVNALMQKYPKAKLIESEICSQMVRNSNKMYFLFYYDDPDYRYVLNNPDVIIHTDQSSLNWNNLEIKFLFTPGHSFGSMCIYINNMLFTGDTIMPYKPYFNGRDSNQDNWENSVSKIESLFPKETVVYPGHGGSFVLGEWNYRALEK